MENKLQVNHIDGDKKNNRVTNLEWCTQSENMQHAHRTRLIRNDKAVKAINKASGEEIFFNSTAEAGRQTGIYNTNIVRCCKGRTQTAGGYYWSYIEAQRQASFLLKGGDTQWRKHSQRILS